MIPGVEVLERSGFECLRGKKVGLLTNPSGIDRNLRSTVDILFSAPEVELKVLFAPEHGVRGDVYAGGRLSDTVDEATGQTRDLTPQLLCMFGGHYVDLPINGRWWKEFADFATRLADTFEGVSLENIRTNGDAANAKRLMSKFRSA